jgi:hypothetical protein
MKKLPIGIQAFDKLIEGGYIYVDKTEIIHRLVTTGATYFLSRPRRFGKSLLLNTLKSLFEGQQALFSGLWIENQWDWSKSDISLNSQYATLTGYTQQELEDYFDEHLQAVQNKLGVERQKNLDELREWYNGYSWDGVQRVYNPFGVLRFFAAQLDLFSSKTSCIFV